MRKLKLRKNLLTAAVGVVLALGVASQAMALAPTFSINPTGANPTGLNGPGIFSANQIAGTSSELLTTTGGVNPGHTGSGWIQINGFSAAGSPLSPLVTGLGINYNLFITFNLIDMYNAGTGTGINTANSTNTVSVLNFKFWADPTHNNVFTAANANPATNATYTDPGLNDILLASGDLITGVSGFDSLGGAYLNSTERFAVCTGTGTGTIGGVAAPAALVAGCTSGLGNKFFAAPVPFFSLAFDAFNNTSQGIATNGNLTSINSAIGTIDFNRVPEPATLALLGLGLLGMGATARRRKV